MHVKAKAMGSGAQGAQTNLQDAYKDDMTLEEAQILALSTLKQHMEEQLTNVNVELAIVTPEEGFCVCDIPHVDGIIAKL